MRIEQEQRKLYENITPIVSKCTKDVNGVACHIRDLQKGFNEVSVETDILSPYSDYSGLYDSAVVSLLN